ncbi:MAG TPA: condensation domain-containing protein, partial [Pseudonocardiaceae bacterium]
TDAPRRPDGPATGAVLTLRVGAARTAALRACALRHGVTLFHVLVAGYSVMLREVTGERDVVVGTPVSGRALPGLADAVGMFVNTVCLRNQVPDEASFAEFLRAVSNRAIEAFEHQDHPFDALLPRLGRVPFDTMLALQRDTLTGEPFLGAAVRLAPDGPGESMFDLNLQVHEAGDELHASWEYRTAIFTEHTVRALFDRLLAVLDAVLADPAAPLRHVLPDVTGAALAAPAIDFDF